jgi:hypothetical protein
MWLMALSQKRTLIFAFLELDVIIYGFHSMANERSDTDTPKQKTRLEFLWEATKEYHCKSLQDRQKLQDGIMLGPQKKY